MFEWIDTQPDCQVQEAEYKRLLGFPPHYVLEGRPRELAEQAREWYARNGRPWIFARQVEGFELATDGVRVGGARFSSGPLRELLRTAQAHGALAAVVSAGRECEEQARAFWVDGKPDEYFFMEMYGSAVVEHLVTIAGGRICAWADGQGMVALPHYSPGYPGWDVADQIKLWELLRHANGQSVPGELRVLDTGMLEPKKSLLALFGVTRHLDKVRADARLVPCENCALPGCQYRRAPHHGSRPQTEDVRRLQADAPAGLRPDAKYSVNLKALRKWSRERLQLTTQPGGAVEARFRYEGTTCSNLGRPLEYEYRIVLAPAAEGYRILEAACYPAPGDTGHMLQCEYIKDPAALMRAVESERPLRGRLLNDVLDWQRPFSPSGCFCDADRRLHKWGLVLEVVHFSLAQRTHESAGARPR